MGVIISSLIIGILGFIIGMVVAVARCNDIIIELEDKLLIYESAKEVTGGYKNL